jgi:hypothetical protein
MVRGNPPRAAFLDEHQEQGCVQRAIGPRLDPWRLHRGTEHAAIEVYYGDIGADEANFPRRECNPTSLQSCAKNLIVPPIKLLAAHVKHPIHIREGGVVEVARAPYAFASPRFHASINSFISCWIIASSLYVMSRLSLRPYSIKCPPYVRLSPHSDQTADIA